MQHISQHLQGQPLETLRSAKLSEAYAPERLERAMLSVQEIFLTLQTAMPARFSSMYPTKDEVVLASRIWAIGLIEAKLSPNQIRHGQAKAIIDSKYCPDLPSFIALCKPSAEDMGLPTPAEAYEEACRNAHPGQADRQWSHPAIYHSAQQVGLFELRSLEKHKTLPLFEAAYQRTVEAILNGEELPEIPKALEDLTNKPRPANWKPSDEDRAHGRKTMAGIMGMLGKKSAGVES